MKLLAWLGAGALAATSLIAAAPAPAQYRGHGGYHRAYHGGGYRHGYDGRGYRRGYYGGGYRRGHAGYRCHRGYHDARRCYR